MKIKFTKHIEEALSISGINADLTYYQDYSLEDIRSITERKLEIIDQLIYWRNGGDVTVIGLCDFYENHYRIKNDITPGGYWIVRCDQLDQAINS